MKNRHSYSTTRHRRRGASAAAATVVESVRSLVSLSGAALHDLFSTRRRREGEGAYKREKEREGEREEGAGIEYRNFNIKQRAVECRSNLPGKRSSRRGRASAAGARPSSSNLCPLCPLTQFAYVPSSPTFWLSKGTRALASRRSKGWIDGGRGRGDRESGWNEPESQERQRNDSLLDAGRFTKGRTSQGVSSPCASEFS